MTKPAINSAAASEDTRIDQSVDSAESPALPVERIGPYQLIDRVGHGGLGEVYRAEQEEPIRRTVAIKLIETGMNSPEVAARFESEIRALGVLSHPNIARALDAGTLDDGRPYCVMEYVSGIPVTDYCDRNRLTVQKRLQMFVQICQAIQHAHQKGIIHRDIKASNVLVTVQDGEAVCKVIDFGLVKALNQRLTPQAGVTLHGELVGTPEYMSPEQAESVGLDIDTRTDVYSLGVLLYELLVGSLPFESSALRESDVGAIRRIIREIEPVPVSQRLVQLGSKAEEIAHKRCTDLKALKRQLSGDLEWITAKAMAKDSTRRYASAAELAADIARHCDDEPVMAAPSSSIYDLRKFTRRHKGIVVAGAITTFALLMAVGQFAEGLLDQRKDRIIAQQEVERARAVTEYMLRTVSAMADTKGSEVKATQILDAASARVDSVYPHRPLIQASIRETLGRFYLGLNLHEPAEQHLRRALDLRQNMLGNEARDSLESGRHLASLLRVQGKLDEAELTLGPALETSRRVLGEDHMETLAQLAEMARLRDAQANPGEAAELLGQVVALAEKAEKMEVEDEWQMASYRLDYGQHLARMRQFEQAEEQLLEALAAFKTILGPEHQLTRTGTRYLVELYEAWGKHAQAAEYRTVLVKAPSQ